MAKGNGIESKGKTKGKQIGTTGTVAPVKSTGGKGGVTNTDLKAVGRNLAKMKAQG
jgi:hypothetical protein